MPRSLVITIHLKVDDEDPEKPFYRGSRMMVSEDEMHGFDFVQAMAMLQELAIRQTTTDEQAETISEAILDMLHQTAETFLEKTKARRLEQNSESV